MVLKNFLAQCTKTLRFRY